MCWLFCWMLGEVVRGRAGSGLGSEDDDDLPSRPTCRDACHPKRDENPSNSLPSGQTPHVASQICLPPAIQGNFRPVTARVPNKEGNPGKLEGFSSTCVQLRAQDRNWLLRRSDFR